MTHSGRPSCTGPESRQAERIHPRCRSSLAHRGAHLIASGADPRRILLLTFSRRASVEMTRRVERICKTVLGDKAEPLADALAWAGTFHSIGARLLREYARQIGMDPAFSIHDREDSADLMNLIRHDLGFSKTEKRFPGKGTCPCHLFPCGEFRRAARRYAAEALSVVRGLGSPAETALCRLCHGEAGTGRAGLRRSVAVLGADGQRPGACRRYR
uniref:UvrD-helicase domain-containing protein n=1 Tax=Komagataeibacter nataicola TaxID=265960 RepID=UPI0038CFFF32